METIYYLSKEDRSPAHQNQRNVYIGNPGNILVLLNRIDTADNDDSFVRINYKVKFQ